MDKVTGKAKGYGFVLFKTRKGAAMALKDPKKNINNRIANCQLASVGPVNGAKNQDVGARKIYVGNVQGSIDKEKFRAFFAKFGEIESGPTGFDKETEGREGLLCSFIRRWRELKGHWRNHTKGQVLAAVAAAQNFALFGQHPGFNPLYGGGSLVPTRQVGGLGVARQSLLGNYGAGRGLQHVIQMHGQDRAGCVGVRSFLGHLLDIQTHMCSETSKIWSKSCGVDNKLYIIGPLEPFDIFLVLNVTDALENVMCQ
ncbi:hypothetical protein GH714_019004 [Hevea brasiliensis]|uniref:RRM domain-containing protein n=1 Tax=Hevea brasiliensis TaxID=3981 RepID=A0A6A6K5N3_HEVBR|nr:hypothetical protein GH714_019004 [Hevea brasiliensis]